MTKTIGSGAVMGECADCPRGRNRRHRARAVALCAAALLGLAPGVSPAAAAERYAVVVSGASGGKQYADSYRKWRNTLATALREKLGFEADRVILLSEDADVNARSTRENVQRTVTALRERLTQDDVLLVVLIGHGTFDGASAKFNLAGPDLDAKEWRQLFDGMAARMVFVNTTGASFPFLAELSGKRRIVITATDSSAQRYDTVFPEYFVAALDQLGADTDKNGRVSIWEAFSYASKAVQQYYEQRGQLSTERSLMDDNGDGQGKEAAVPGDDGALARALYLDPDPTIAGADAVLAGMQKRKAALELEIEELKTRKNRMTQEEFEAEFEKLAVELARVSRVIRSRS